MERKRTAGTCTEPHIDSVKHRWVWNQLVRRDDGDRCRDQSVNESSSREVPAWSANM
jgi:hypothetical protein